jgi:hypothetical protein
MSETKTSLSERVTNKNTRTVKSELFRQYVDMS